MLQQVTMRKIDEHPADIGCEAATKYLKEQGIEEPSFCHKCPFLACVVDIRNQTKQLLKNSELIEAIFKLDKQGKTLCEICESYHGQSPFTIKNWIANQKRIQRIINKYRWATPYLNL